MEPGLVLKQGPLGNNPSALNSELTRHINVTPIVK